MFSEKILEDMLFKALEDKESDFLYDRGLEMLQSYSHLKRQLSLGKYGIPDIVTIDSIDEKLFLANIIELKITPFCSDSLGQLLRYMTGIEQYFKRFDPEIKCVTLGVLICAKGAIKSDDLFLLNFIDPYVQIYAYSFDLEKGITFELISSHSSDSRWVKTDSKIEEFIELKNMVQLASIRQKKLIDNQSANETNLILLK